MPGEESDVEVNGAGAGLGGRLVDVLPTVNSRDYKDTHIGVAKHRPHDRDVLSRALVDVLPTPDVRGDNRKSEGFDNGGHNFYDIIQNVDWGKYAPAVSRWEQVLGREAPPPTNPSSRSGRPQLSERFTEWMMGLPADWITDVPDISRNEAIRLCGNGVVPQQAAAALSWLYNLHASQHQHVVDDLAMRWAK